MSNTYSWQFESLDVYPTYNGLTNVVQSIHWIMIADDGAGHTTQSRGEQIAGAPDPDNFVPFEDLTAAIVQTWVETEMGSELNTVKAFLDSVIADQVAPRTRSLAPPWS